MQINCTTGPHPAVRLCRNKNTAHRKNASGQCGNRGCFLTELYCSDRNKPHINQIAFFTKNPFLILLFSFELWLKINHRFCIAIFFASVIFKKSIIPRFDNDCDANKASTITEKIKNIHFYYGLQCAVV